MAKARLTFAVYGGGELRQRETLDQDIIKLGKDPNSHLSIADDDVARMHAVIEVQGVDDITLIHLGNDPQTSVNGAPVNKVKIHAGDQIEVGGTRIVLEKVEGPVAQSETFVAAPSNPFAAAGSTPFAASAAPSSPFAAAAQATSPFAASSAFAPSNPFVSAPAAAVPSAFADAPTGATGYRMLKSGPAVPPEECESTASAVEVSVSWGANVLASTTLSPPRSFYVGEETGKGVACDFFMPSEVLGTTRMPVAVVSGNEVAVVLPSGATGFVDVPQQGRRSLEQLAGLAKPCAELSGARQLALPAGARAEIKLGDFVFRVAAVNAGKRLPVPFGAGGFKDFLPYALMAFAFAAGILGFAYFAMPDYGLLASEGVDKSRIAMLQEWLNPDALKELEEKETEQVADEDADNKEGGTGTKAKGEEGQMGDEKSQDKNKRYAVQGNEDEIKQLARDRALREATSFGLIGMANAGMMGDASAPIAPWGGDIAIGNEEISANGNMWGDEIGTAFGAGGLGLSGWGEGGGGRGEGIGLGNIGTYGHGAGDGSGQGFGSGHGRLRGSHRASSPSLRVGKTEVSGRLPAEVIRRTIRNNFGRFQMCYEKGLARNPNLEGRVTVRFIIGNDGKVSNVSNGGSDLPDAEVVTCVMHAYSRVSFPQPEGGIVTVVYPISFTPGS